MDSGNSGSVQSSSGGSEEFDSRTESISAFFNNNPSSHIGHHGSLGSQQPPQPPPPLMQQQHQSHPSPSMLFDPLSSYLDHPLSRSPLLNLDAAWSKNLRSEPNCNDLGGGFMASSSSSSPTQQLLQAQSRATTFSSMQQQQQQQILQGPENGTTTTKGSVPGTTDQPVRNSKKRSRASRRAPTTVLTTDTTNFRAMVQEFTGIPAPPFTASSPFQRTRLDLFGTTPSSSPHYLLRPFAQKLHYPHPSFPASSMVDAITSTPSTNSSSTSTSINYHQLPSELGLLKQHPQNPLNINSMQQQNPILNYVSLLQQQPPPKYPVPPNEPPLKMGVFENFGLGQGHGNINTNLNGLQNMVPSSSEATGTKEHDQSLMRSINGNFPVPSSDFRGDKGPENVATRSEGMVESWICSSD